MNIISTISVLTSGIVTTVSLTPSLNSSVVEAKLKDNGSILEWIIPIKVTNSTYKWN